MFAHRTVLALLALLALLNVAWIAASPSSDPGSFVFLYGLAWFLGARRRRYFPVVLMGALGLALHVHGITAGRTAGFGPLDRWFLAGNLALPVPLIAAGLKAMRGSRTLGAA